MNGEGMSLADIIMGSLDARLHDLEEHCKCSEWVPAYRSCQELEGVLSKIVQFEKVTGERLKLNEGKERA